MSLHDRIMALPIDRDAHPVEMIGFRVARKEAAILAKEADELMAEMAKALIDYAWIEDAEGEGANVANDALNAYYKYKESTNARDERWSNLIEWSGGDRPVDFDEQVYWQIRGGEEFGPITAGHLDWSHSELCEHIIAYRYKIKEPENGIADPDEEECLQLAYERMNEESVKVSLDELREQKYSAYFKDVRHIDTLDVYRVLSLFDCEKHGHPIGHAAKKLLLSGSRTGGKDVEFDVREAIDTLYRWLEMREEDARA